VGKKNFIFPAEEATPLLDTVHFALEPGGHIENCTILKQRTYELTPD
jgi:hypothetical protein